MKSSKNDFLKECMSELPPIPIDEFNKGYCLLCGNHDCSRSAANNSKFEIRVNSWKERLFTNVNRANDRDPNFESIRQKKFLPILNNGGPINIETKNDEEPITERSPNISMYTEPEIDENIEEIKKEIPITRADETQKIIAHPTQINTSFSQELYVGKETVRKETVQQELVIKPGGSFTFGDDDE